MRLLINLGCGPLATPTRWLDYDGSWNLIAWKLPWVLRFPVQRLFGNQHRWPDHVRYANLLRKLPFESDSVAAVYASHVWEHLYYEEAKAVTKEVFRILLPGGRVRLAVPGLHELVRQYVENEGQSGAAEALNGKLLFRGLSRPRKLHQRIYESMTDFHSHKFMYDPPALVDMLKNAGFDQVSERKCRCSDIPEIIDIESEDRVGAMKGFAVEGTKPELR